MTSAPICPNEVEVRLSAQDIPTQMKRRALENGPNVDTSRSFRLGHRHYLARPSEFKRDRHFNGLGMSDKASLATCFRVEKNQIISADYVRAWRASYLNDDDAFDPALLKEVIFGGVDYVSDVQLEDDAQAIFKAWDTHFSNLVNGSDQSISNGPYLMKKDSVYSIWRVYDDRQLAFVQAMWPSIEDER